MALVGMASPSQPHRFCQAQRTVFSHSGPPHDGAVPGGCQQDDLCPPDMLLRTVPVADTALNAAQSVALSLIWVVSCIPQTRMTESAGESARESKSQICSVASPLPSSSPSRSALLFRLRPGYRMPRLSDFRQNVIRATCCHPRCGSCLSLKRYTWLGLYSSETSRASPRPVRSQRDQCIPDFETLSANL